MLCITSDGAVALLNRMLDGIPTLFHLYCNDVPRSTETILSDLVAADWPAYRPIFDRRWSPALWVDVAAFSWTDQKTWIRGSGGAPRLVYGYFVTIGRPHRLLWYEPREGGPIPMVLPTDCVTITPELSYSGPPT